MALNIMKIKYLVVIYILITLFIVGCAEHESAGSIEVGSISPVRVEAEYVVVTQSYVRLFEQPDPELHPLSFAREGDVFPVIGKTPEIRNYRGSAARWYLVDDDGRKLWLFAGECRIFPGKAKALTFSGGITAD